MLVCSWRLMMIGMSKLGGTFGLLFLEVSERKVLLQIMCTLESPFFPSVNTNSLWQLETLACFSYDNVGHQHNLSFHS